MLIAILLLDKSVPDIKIRLLLVMMCIGGILPFIFSLLGPKYYNFVELFRTDRILPGVRFMVIWWLGPISAYWAVSFWLDNKWVKAVSCLVGSGLVIWGLLRRSVTVESIDDILGTPVLLWPIDLEYIMRFFVLYSFFMWIPIFCAAMMYWIKRIAFMPICYYCGFVILSPIIINSYSPSDNVRELFTINQCYLFSILCLAIPWIFIVIKQFIYQKINNEISSCGM